METGKMLKKIWGIHASNFFTFVFPQVGCKLANFFTYGFIISWLYIHHSIQLLLAVITILLISIQVRNKVYSWGFNF